MLDKISTETISGSGYVPYEEGYRGPFIHSQKINLCCKQFFDHSKDRFYAEIVYDSGRAVWCLMDFDGDLGKPLRYCPFCGKRLSKNRRLSSRKINSIFRNIELYIKDCRNE